MNKLFFIYVSLFATSAIADRPTMSSISADPSSKSSTEETGIRQTIEGIAKALNSQDCVEYASFFSKELQSKARRDSGLFFAKNNTSFNLLEQHILSQEEDSAEVAISYEGSGKETVSRVFLKREDGCWKVIKEVPVKTENNFQQSYPERIPVQTTSTPNRCGSNNTCGTSNPFNVTSACRDYGLSPVSSCSGGSCR